jgi:dTDP-4-amino-4,6-dideoxygalactose transaminase
MNSESNKLKILFNRFPATPNSEIYMKQALSLKISGDAEFTQKFFTWMEERFNTSKALLTTSCSHALNMATYLCGVREGDEIIMSSYTFTSTANAFVGQEMRIVFVDIRPDTMNIDETLIESAITDKTQVIVPMYYAGVSCEIDVIKDIAQRHNLLIIEDAAQGVMSKYKGKALGTFGD